MHRVHYQSFFTGKEMDFFTLVGLNVCFYILIYAICLWLVDCDLQLAFAEKFGKKLVRLRGKVIWITDASTELGKMMAFKSAGHRGKLVLSGKSLEEVEKIRILCLKFNSFIRPRDILTLQFEMGDLSAHRWALEKVIRHFGRLDILILNEDKWDTNAWEENPPAADRLLFQSNVFGVISLSRLAIRFFNRKRKGKLAVTSSIAGLIGVPFSGCYAGTKHALHGYFNGLRIEKLGENIQTTLLCLGPQERLPNNSKFIEDERKGKGPGAAKMTPERCAHLCLTAIVNDLDEVWMAVFPILPLIYGIRYFPNVTKSMLKYLKSREL